MKTLIAPSILSADFSRLGDEVTALDAAGADWIHIDIMDGHFVPNLTFGPQIVSAIRGRTGKRFDTHLMVAPVDPLLEGFAAAGVDGMTVHPESGPHLHRTLQAIKGLGKRAGVALNPATPVDWLDHIIGMVDLVLVMTVNPGFGGQEFLPLTDKIAAVRARITASGRDIDLQVDGGINADTARRCVAAGANVLVAGTAIFKGSHGQADYAARIADLRGDAKAAAAP